MTKLVTGEVGELVSGVIFRDVHHEASDRRAIGCVNLPHELLQKILSPGNRNHAHARQRQPFAMARPMPMLAPVTTAVLDLRLRSMFGSFSLSNP